MNNLQLVSLLNERNAPLTLTAWLRGNPQRANIKTVLMGQKDETLLIDICHALGIRTCVESSVQWLRHEGRLLRLKLESELSALEARYDQHATETEKRILGDVTSWAGLAQGQWQTAQDKLRQARVLNAAEYAAQREFVRGKWMKAEEMLVEKFAARIAWHIESAFAGVSEHVA